jgi:hypothetical protein
MITLEADELVFRFPDIEPSGQFSINFMRTLRIPDTDRTYSLPPGLGSFPLRHAEDYSDNLAPETVSRGGVIMPIWQSEAMWMSFHNEGPDWTAGRYSDSGSGLPVAVKIAAGKINAISGEPWSPGLRQNPQDYIVSPLQPWLDGFAVEKGVVRQFVAMPLGDGYSVEEQLTQSSEWGGLQISVTPLKSSVWHSIRDEDFAGEVCSMMACCESISMGFGAGGRMHQEIYEDIFEPSHWDWDSTQRVFVSLLHAKDWKSVIGEDVFNEPPTAEDYARQGLPWFDYYAKDLEAVSGSPKLAQVKSVAQLHLDKTGAHLSNSSDFATGQPVQLSNQRPHQRRVRTSDNW